MLAIGINNKKHAYFLYLGIFYFDAERYEDALKAFRQSLELSPSNALVTCYTNLINYINGHDVLQSLTAIKNNIKSTNTDFKGKFLVHCEKILSQNSHKVRTLDECLAEKSSSNAHSSDIGFIIDKFICKISHLFNSKDNNAHLNLIEARINLKNSRIDDAIKNYRSALELHPGLSVAVDGLIQIFLTTKKYDALFELIKSEDQFKDIQVLFGDGNFTENFDKLSDDVIRSQLNIILIISQVYYKLSDYPKSYKCFNVLAKHFTKEFYIHYYCGLCCIAMNNLKDAFDQFRLSMEIINPNVVEKRLDEMIKCCS